MQIFISQSIQKLIMKRGWHKVNYGMWEPFA